MTIHIFNFTLANIKIDIFGQMVETDTDNWKLMSLRKRPALPKPVNKIINDVNNSSINAGSNPALTIFIKPVYWKFVTNKARAINCNQSVLLQTTLIIISEYW